MIESDAILVTTFACDGVTTVIPITFETSRDNLGNAEHIKVQLQYEESSVVLYRDMVEGDDYTISGLNVVLADVRDTPEKVIISRDVSLKQLLSFITLGKVDPRMVEAALDKLTMIAQQQKSLNARAIYAPITDPDKDMELPGADQIAGKFLAFNEDGEPIGAEGASSVPMTSFAAALALAEGADEHLDILVRDDLLETTKELVRTNLEVYSKDEIDANIDQGVKTTNSPEFAGMSINGIPLLMKPLQSFATGLSLTIGSIGVPPALAALDSTHVAFIDPAIEELRTYEWDGSEWSMIGAALSIAGIGPTALAALDSTHVAYIDGALDELRTYEWDGSAWSMIGSGLSVPTTVYLALAALDSTHVVYLEGADDELTTYVWNGSTWSQEGSALSISGVGSPALAALDSTHVAVVDNSTQELRTYEWDGSEWSLLGEACPLGDIGAAVPAALAALDSTHVAYIDSEVEEFKIYEWSGSAWRQTSPALSFPGTGAAALAALDSTHVAFVNGFLYMIKINWGLAV